MIGKDIPDTYDDESKFTFRERCRVERLLKREIAHDIVWAQYNRAKGDAPNGYAVRGIGEDMRILRRFMKKTGGERTDPLIEMELRSHELSEKLEFEGSRTVREIIESLHETGSKPEVC